MVQWIHKTNKNIFSTTADPAHLLKSSHWFSSPSWHTLTPALQNPCRVVLLSPANRSQGTELKSSTIALPQCVSWEFLSMQAHSPPFLCLNLLRLSAACSAFFTIAPLYTLNQLSFRSSNVHTSITAGSSPNIYCCLLKVHLMWTS